MNILEEYVKLLIENEEKQMTWGMLKKELKKFIRNKKGKGLAKALIGFVPWAGGARDLAEVILSLTKIPDNKRPKGFLKKFDIDDQIQLIIDNQIESQFVKYVIKYINQKDENEVITDFNMTNVLNNFLQKKFKGRGVDGFK